MFGCFSVEPRTQFMHWTRDGTFCFVLYGVYHHRFSSCQAVLLSGRVQRPSSRYISWCLTMRFPQGWTFMALCQTAVFAIELPEVLGVRADTTCQASSQQKTFKSHLHRLKLFINPTQTYTFGSAATVEILAKKNQVLITSFQISLASQGFWSLW